MADPQLYCIHPGDVPIIWPMVRDLLNAAILKTDLGHTADLERDVCGGNGVLWVAGGGGKIDAAAVAVLTRTDAHLTCCILACGGASPRKWVHHLEKIEAWARAEGAAKVRIFGRKGWLRLLNSYRVSNVVMEKAL